VSQLFLLFSSSSLPERVADLVLFISSVQHSLDLRRLRRIYEDTRTLHDLRDLSVTDDNGTRVLRLRFKTGDPLDLVTDGELYPLFSSILSDSNFTSHSFRPTSARNGEF